MFKDGCTRKFMMAATQFSRWCRRGSKNGVEYQIIDNIEVLKKVMRDPSN